MSNHSIPEYARGYEQFRGTVSELVSESSPAWKAPVRAPQGSPNVILMLIDDMGFSDIAPFGGEIDTPTLDALSDTGYRFTNYRTAPMCSPARASLLTGLNPHRAGFSVVAHADPGFPGATLQIDDDVPTIAESFQESGYATFMVGKWHVTKESTLNDGASKSGWPLQRGFDRYFGSMDGFTTLYHPHRLICDNSPLVIDDVADDYYLTDDLTDQALGMIKALRANEPEKPFFLYFAHQAVHAPMQGKPEDIEKYRGAYNRGWDHVRDDRFRRQIQEGLFPAGTEMVIRNDTPGAEVQAWDSLTESQQLLFARYMEVYAAMVDNIDQNLRRLTDHLKRIGEYENTIIAFTSDNGATGEGGPNGTRSYFSQFGFDAEVPARWERDVPRDPDLIGGPQTFVHYPRGWAYASNTPFRYYKRDTFEGGVHAPLIVSWPAGLPRLKDDSGIRDHSLFVTDLGLTILNLAGVPHLTARHGLPAKEVDGVSFAEVIRDPATAPVRTSQYAEILGNRSYYRDNWKIVTRHVPGTRFDQSEWELYDIVGDPTEVTNLASEMPDLLNDLIAEWTKAAWENTVFPLDDDGSLQTRRPDTELAFEAPVTLFPGTPTLERYRSGKLIHLRNFDIHAEFDAAAAPQGVLVAHGDQGGGYVLFVEGDELCFSYNQFGEMFRMRATLPSGAGKISVRFTALEELCWRVELVVNDQTVAELPDVLQLVGMCPFTGISVGIDRGSPVDWELFERRRGYAFTDDSLSVTYIPGEKAPYNRELIIGIEHAVQRIFE